MSIEIPNFLDFDATRVALGRGKWGKAKLIDSVTGGSVTGILGDPSNRFVTHTGILPLYENANPNSNRTLDIEPTPRLICVLEEIRLSAQKLFKDGPFKSLAPFVKGDGQVRIKVDKDATIKIYQDGEFVRMGSIDDIKEESELAFKLNLQGPWSMETKPGTTLSGVSLLSDYLMVDNTNAKEPQDEPEFKRMKW
jgi:hypothetical protein